MLKRLKIHDKHFLDFKAIRYVLAITAVLSCLLGLTVIFGWITHNQSIIQIHPTYAPMQVNTALYFVFSGLTLGFFVLRLKWLSWLFLLALFTLSGLTIKQYLFDINYGIDQWLFYYDLPIDINNPGRPAPNTAFCFFILAITMTLLLLFKRNLNAFFAELLACLAISIASSSLFGYILQIYSITTWYEFTGMALHTSAGIVGLGLGILVANALYLFYKGKFFFGPLISFIFITFYVTYFIWEGSATNQKLAIEKLAKNSATYIAHSLAKNLDYSTKAIRRVVMRWEALGDFNETLWKSDAKSYQSDIGEILGFYWFDQDFRLQNRIILPQNGTENLSDETIQEVLKRTKFDETVVDLYERRIGKNLLILTPLYVDKVFKGALVVDVKVSRLIEQSIPEYLLKYYTIGIFDQGKLIFGIEADSNVDLDVIQTAQVQSPLIDWEVVVIPTEEALLQSFPKELIILSGLLFAGFLALISYLFSVAAKARDISEKAYAKLKAILNSSPYMIISTDLKGEIIEFNKAAEESLGFSKVEMAGKETPKVFHDEEEIKVRALELSEKLGRKISPTFEVFVALSNEGLPDVHEWTYIRKDQSRFPVQLSITRVLDRQGNPLGYVGNAIDLTRLKEAETMKNELISITSHELRTPSASIHSALELIINSPNLSDEENTLLKIAYDNSERLIRLTTDILDMQKMEAGKLEFIFKKVSLQDLMDRAILSNAPVAQESGIKLELTDSIPQVTLMADADRLLQVLTNFISNAIKNSPVNGRVTLKAKTLNEMVRISVTDEGSGIPDEYRLLIFKKFSQVPGNKSNKKGTGLGLSISKAIIEKHGGEVGFDTGPKGTTFWLEIPVV
ncbi:MAG: PAS domain S-box protein [Chlamydiia bacterium]|nr:PAS domain S-box protein [Chlamydiia bacterium]